MISRCPKAKLDIYFRIVFTKGTSFIHDLSKVQTLNTDANVHLSPGTGIKFDSFHGRTSQNWRKHLANTEQVEDQAIYAFGPCIKQS